MSQTKLSEHQVDKKARQAYQDALNHHLHTETGRASLRRNAIAAEQTLFPDPTTVPHEVVEQANVLKRISLAVALGGLELTGLAKDEFGSINEVVTAASESGLSLRDYISAFGGRVLFNTANPDDYDALINWIWTGDATKDYHEVVSLKKSSNKARAEGKLAYNREFSSHMIGENGEEIKDTFASKGAPIKLLDPFHQYELKDLGMNVAWGGYGKTMGSSVFRSGDPAIDDIPISHNGQFGHMLMVTDQTNKQSIMVGMEGCAPGANEIIHRHDMTGSADDFTPSGTAIFWKDLTGQDKKLAQKKKEARSLILSDGAKHPIAPRAKTPTEFGQAVLDANAVLPYKYSGQTVQLSSEKVQAITRLSATDLTPEMLSYQPLSPGQEYSTGHGLLNAFKLQNNHHLYVGKEYVAEAVKQLEMYHLAHHGQQSIAQDNTEIASLVAENLGRFEQQVSEWNQDLDAEYYGGIGIELDAEFTITKIYSDSPAARAGLKVGQSIITIKGQRVDPAHHSLDDLIPLLRGKPGEMVDVVVQDPVTHQYIEHNLGLKMMNGLSEREADFIYDVMHSNAMEAFFTEVGQAVERSHTMMSERAAFTVEDDSWPTFDRHADGVESSFTDWSQGVSDVVDVDVQPGLPRGVPPIGTGPSR